MNRTRITSLMVLAIALTAASAGYIIGTRSRHSTQPVATPLTREQNAPSSPAPAAATPSRQVLYWYDPMVPDKRFEQPGKSPFMDMPLRPRYADEEQDSGGVRVSARQQQNLGVQTASAERRTRSSALSGYGTVVINQHSLRTVVAPSGGVVEQLNINAVQQPVQAGQTLAMLWNPGWAAAQQEYLAVRQLGDAALSKAARQKLALMFMPESVIRDVERSGKPQPRLALRAPQSGYVNRLDVRVGAQLTPAQPLFELAYADPAWLEIDYPAWQAATVHQGDTVLATSDSWPGEAFHGQISEVLPQLDTTTRTLKARIELDNPGQRLKPGMYLRVQLAAAQAQTALMIPQSALLMSSQQNRVLVSEGQGYFTPRQVQTGAMQDGWVEILSGLNEGEHVVTSGQFLLDSEASLHSALASFSNGTPQEAKPAASSPARDYQATGIINAINGRQVTIAHDAIEALGWPPMIMDFTADAALPDTLRPGVRVTFRFLVQDSGATLRAIQPVATIQPDVTTTHGGHP